MPNHSFPTLPRPRFLLIAPIAALLLSACVVAPYPRYGGYSQPVPADGGVIVDVPPPAPYVEVVPAIPFAGAVWLRGYWGWHGGSHRHHWVPGRWDRPRPGHQWRPHTWVPRGERWHSQGGGWYRH